MLRGAGCVPRKGIIHRDLEAENIFLVGPRTGTYVILLVELRVPLLAFSSATSFRRRGYERLRFRLRRKRRRRQAEGGRRHLGCHALGRIGHRRRIRVRRRCSRGSTSGGPPRSSCVTRRSKTNSTSTRRRLRTSEVACSLLGSSGHAVSLLGSLLGEEHDRPCRGGIPRPPPGARAYADALSKRVLAPSGAFRRSISRRRC